MFILSLYGGNMNIDKYVPSMYKKNIFDINYKLLKEKKIRCIIFDLDNTLLIFDEKKVSKETIELIKNLKKDFDIVIMSNNFKRRISNICDCLDVNFVSFALKPLSKGFNEVKKRYEYENHEICIIGDQLISDVLGGNRASIMTILVDPLSNNDLKITKINRMLERHVLKKLTKTNVLERGKYYES